MGNTSVSQADFSFVHFTDTHIMAGGTYGDQHLDTTACLQQVIDTINALQPLPAFAVVGGDLVSPDLLDRSRVLADTEYEPSYHLLRRTLDTLHCPTYLLLGNHDNRPAFYRVMQPAIAASDKPYYYSFDYQGYHFVALDSHVPGKAPGGLDSAQLAWLRDDLEAHRNQPTLVFVHHHPWPIGLAWMDAMHLQNGGELVALLRQFPHVQWMICGHVHLDHVVQQDGLTMLTTPATCFQLSKVSQTRKLLAGPPGFRLVHVKDQVLSTRVMHLFRGGIEEL